AHPFARGADRARFPEFYAELDAASGPPATAGATADEAVCVAPITYTGQAEIQRDIANFKAALKAAGAVEGFLPVAAPASVIPDRRNEYYASDADCLHAIADAMRVEYRAIIDAGLLLQLDDARLAVTMIGWCRRRNSTTIAAGSRCTSRRSTMPWRASPRIACATTSAGEAGPDRIPA